MSKKNEKDEIWYVKKSTDPDTTGVLVSKINNPDDDSFITVFSGTKEECDRFCDSGSSSDDENLPWLKRYMNSCGNEVDAIYAQRDINNAACEIMKALYLEVTSRLNDGCTSQTVRLFSVDEIEYIMNKLGITANAGFPDKKTEPREMVITGKLETERDREKAWFVNKSGDGYSIDPCMFWYNNYKPEFRGTKKECENYVYEHTHHRMTNYELAKWMSEGPAKNEVREVKRNTGDTNYVSGFWVYKYTRNGPENDDSPVPDDIKIRVNKGEWMKPMIEG